ncbi:MAG TPA: hypothetical protein VK689_10605, partial [Armatimonadota bacterium]|nr:hypothetical protein [Armatimonadota bacterium]
MRSLCLAIGAVTVFAGAAATAPGAPMPAARPSHAGAPRPAVAFSPDGKRLAVGGYGEVAVVDMA